MTEPNRKSGNRKIGDAPARLSDRKPEPETCALLLDARAAGALCGFSRASWWKLQQSGRCPLPIRLGRKVLWRRSDLEGWIAQGCPPRDAARAAEYRHVKALELATIGEGGGR